MLGKLSKLSPRERILALVALLLAPFALVMYLVIVVGGGLADRTERIDSLRQEQDHLLLQQVAAKRVLARGEVYREESLPPDTDKSIIDYQSWLRHLVEESFGKGNGQVQPGASFSIDAGPRDRIYLQQSFRVTGEVTIRQVTEFLFRFYEAKILHRISSISLNHKIETQGDRTVADNDQLALDVTIQVAILSDARSDRDFANERRERMPRTLDDYHHIVTRRNLFGPPNESPEFQTRASNEVELGENIEIEIAAEDPDSNGGPIQYELVDSSPELTLEKRGERHYLVAAEPPVGRYQATVRATDSGWPSKSEELELSVSVREAEVDTTPPPEPVKYASQAFVSGFTTVNDEKAVWIKIPLPEPRLHQLRVGESFELDELEWTVHSIDAGRVTLRVNDNLLTFRHRGNLAEPVETTPID